MSGKTDEALLQRRFDKIITQRYLLVLDQNFRIEAIDPAASGLFNCRPDEMVGRRIYEMCDAQWNIVELRHLLEKRLAASDWVEDYRVEHKFEANGRRTLHLNTLRMSFADNRVRILLAICDSAEQAVCKTR